MKNWTTAAAIVGAAIASTALVACGDSAADDTELARGPVAAPAEYQSWVDQAGSTCEHITPALIAAQIDLQSAWDTRAASAAGAQGLSQLLPQTWDAFGIDADGNGVASPFDPADAIMTLAAVDCDLAGRAAKDQAAGLTMDGDLTDIVLYAFSCGYDCILTGGPVPAFGEASTYVEQIKSKVNGQP